MELTDRFDSVCVKIGAGHATAVFYPYSELKHTWRREGHHVAFKISDYLKDSPDHVLDSMACYLVGRALEEECPPNKAEAYLSYSKSKELWLRVRETYLARARNLSLASKGAFRDLRVVFDYVNSTYFRGAVKDPVLAWVNESPARRLGFYFEPLNLLAVNRILDSERVPRHALEFVVYHELLHHIDAGSGRPKRRIHHTKSFREQEMRFSSYDEAETWLRRLASKNRSKNR